MQVIGTTTQQEVFVASKDRPFRINEILVIEDHSKGNLRGEVIQTQSYNRYIPLAQEANPLVDETVRRGLEQVGFVLEEETIHLAKVRLLEELSVPVEVGSPVRIPCLDEIRELLLPVSPDRGFVIGVIKGTEELSAELPTDLANISPLYDRKYGIMSQVGVPFIFNFYALQEYPHIGIFGGSGSGKSFAMRVILEEIMRHRIPGLCFDPHNEMSFSNPFPGEQQGFSRTFERESALFTVGSDVGVRFEDLTTSELESLLAAAGGGLSEAMLNAVAALHEKNDSLITFTRRLEELIAVLEKGEEEFARLREIYGPNSKQEARLRTLLSQGLHPSTVKGLRWRLNRLEMEGIFVKDISRIIEAVTERRLAVIRGPIWLLNVFAAYLLRKLYLARRAYRDALERGSAPPAKFPPFIIATDEAHNFAPQRGEFIPPARSVLREIAQEGRKYGVFLILATQRPALLDDTITAQLNTKIIFRTVRSQDIAVIREETDIAKEDADRLPYLPSGHAFVSSAITGRTIAVRVRAAKTVAPHSINPFEELQTDFEPWANLRAALSKHFPLHVNQLHLILPQLEEEIERPLTFDEVRRCLDEMCSENMLIKEEGPFGPTYKRVPIST